MLDLIRPPNFFVEVVIKFFLHHQFIVKLVFIFH